LQPITSNDIEGQNIIGPLVAG